MKSYTITVNGTVYDVTVEEKAGGAAAPAASAQAAAPAPAPAAAPAPQQQNNSVPIQLGDLSDFEEILSDGEVPF